MNDREGLILEAGVVEHCRLQSVEDSTGDGEARRTLTVVLVTLAGDLHSKDDIRLLGEGRGKVLGDADDGDTLSFTYVCDGEQLVGLSASRCEENYVSCLKITKTAVYCLGGRDRRENSGRRSKFLRRERVRPDVRDACLGKKSR